MTRICILLLLLPLARPAASQSEAAFETISELVRAEVSEDGIGGLSFGIVSGGKLVHAGAFGYADIEREISATPEHVYRIGSITKQFTALALLKMAEDSILSLTDPVEKHVPEIGEIRGAFAGSPPPTLLQLATMTSGFAREPEDLPRFLVGPAPEWMGVVLEALPAVKYDFPPGTRYQYSNIGYAILGAALERASGRDYMEYLREEILSPLSMNDTDFVPRAHFEERLASGYDVEDGRVDAETPAWEHLGRGYKVPNGALYSTVSDLARFLSFLLGHGPEEVLAPKTREESFDRLYSADGAMSSGYGMGFSAVRRGERVFLGHGGSVAGYRAGAYFDREAGVGVVFLRNVTGSKLDLTELAFRALEEAVRIETSTRTRGAASR